MKVNERYPDTKKQKESSLLGKLLREKRKHRNATLESAANKIGITFQQLWQLEDGTGHASVFTLECIGKFYNIPIQTLIKLNFKTVLPIKTI